MAKKCHKSEELEKRIGQRVKLTFFDGRTEEGILGRDKYSDRYQINNLCFYKTHLTKIW